MVLFSGDLILNIGNPATKTIPTGTRIALALLSSAAVRSSGFQGIAISSLTPATQYVFSTACIHLANIPYRVLYIVAMYIAIYPIAMRSVMFLLSPTRKTDAKAVCGLRTFMKKLRSAFFLRKTMARTMRRPYTSKRIVYRSGASI